MSDVDVIIVAAGLGTRLGRSEPKALVAVGGRPLLAWSVEAFATHPRTRRIVLLAPPGHEPEVMAAAPATTCDLSVVAGGATRAESVAIGLRELDVDSVLVAVHDAARPLVTREIIDAVLAGIGDADGAIAAAPLADTPKRVGPGGEIVETLDRRALWRAETPQILRTTTFRHAVAAAISADRLDRATDCASLVEATGGRVRVVGHGLPNMKITAEADIALAEVLLGPVR